MLPVNVFDRPLISDAIRERQRSVPLDGRGGRGAPVSINAEGRVLLWSWKLRRMVSYIDRRGESDTHENGHEQKQVKGASEKMRFNVGVTFVFQCDLKAISQKETKETKTFVVLGLGRTFVYFVTFC